MGLLDHSSFGGMGVSVSLKKSGESLMTRLGKLSRYLC